MTTKAQLALYCADHFPSHIFHTGVTYTHAAIAVVVSLAVGFGLGWYIKGRGLPGFKIDLGNAKTVVTTDAQKAEAAVAAL